MSLSFWITVILGILTFVPVFWDHGEALAAYRSSTGKIRRRKLGKLVFLWILPAIAFLALIVSGLESCASNRHAALQTRIFLEQSNQWEQTKVDLDQTKKEAEELRKKVARRTIPPEKRAEVIPLLRQLGPIRINIASIIANDDSIALAGEFRSLFTDAGWTIGEYTQQATVPIVPRGLILISQTNIDARRETIRGVLSRIAPVTTMHDPTRNYPGLTLMVGVKE